MASALDTYVALLRGVNVGGNARVSMRDLQTCFERMGFAAVRTYINSGNVVFRARPADPRALERKIERGLHAAFSMPLPVAVRSFREIDDLLSHLPPSWRDGGRGLKCNVIFLRPAIDSPRILDGLRPVPDIEELRYHPGALLWSARTSDLTRSAMLKVNRMPIYREMTVRILATVRKLHELMREGEAEAAPARAKGRARAGSGRPSSPRAASPRSRRRPAARAR